MKKVLSFNVFALFCLIATAQVSKTINVSRAGDLRYLLTYTERNTITNLTVTGNIDYRDFIFKSMKELKVLDISGVVIDEYKEGSTGIQLVHPANELPKNAFGDTYSGFKNTTIQEVMLPSNLTTIRENAFAYCIGLKSITIPNTVKSIGREVFWECSALTSITIPDSVTSISNSLFFGCTALKDVTIPNSVTSIGGGAFAECSALTAITIPNSVTSIGGGAFVGCSALTAITIPNTVISIGSYAFSNCSALTAITIPNTVISIGSYALAGAAITSFTFPNSMTVIPNGMFSGCKFLTTISIPNHITEIGDKAFSDSWLESITIPNSVTKIGEASFSSCPNLQEVYFGKNTTSIGFMAFSACTLKFIYIPQITPPLIEQYTFHCVNKISCKLYVPKDALSVYKSTDFWKEFSDVNEIHDTYDVTVHAGIGGAVTFNNSIIPNNSSVQVYFGKNCSFSILPESGYQIETLTLDGVNVINQLSNNQYTTPSIRKNSTLEVTFSKIKYLLSIKSAESGSADLVCVYGDILSFSFTSSLGWKINSIIYNGTNVTNSLINGLYTISGITGNSTLNISFESSASGVPENIKNNIKVYSNQSEIIIDGANLGEVITIFDTTGKQLKSQKSIGERISIPISNSGVYIVRVTEKSYKVFI